MSVSFIVRGLIQRMRLSGLPALSLVPDFLEPPNGCCPTTAPVGLSLKYRFPAAYFSTSAACVNICLS